MSTIIYDGNPDGSYLMLTKGAPEVMKTLFIKEKLPKNYQQKLDELADEGLRVIALGSKRIDRL